MRLASYLTSTTRYTIDDLPAILESITEDDCIFDGHKDYFYNVPCSFDIETSSFYQDNEKRACMYVWMFGIAGAVIVGRTWNEFITLCEELSTRMELSGHKRLICYCHNLEYEFQWMRKYFRWTKVFSIQNRKPLYAINTLGIEFRCSYLLSGYSLAKLSEKLKTYKIAKMVGDLDYNLIRVGGDNPTPLSEKEWGYCVNDVRVVMSYIWDEMEKNGNISKIPLTKTGYVRRYVRENCFGEKYSKKYNHYRGIMSSLRIQSVEEYNQLKRAFTGGFTHACGFYARTTLYNVSSDDFQSDYPAQVCGRLFPMSSAEMVTINNKEELEDNIKHYCCLFDVEFINLHPIITDENYISISRCSIAEKPVINNGRLVSALKVKTTITEQDFLIIKKFYRWDKMGVANFRRYRRGYLPTDFVKSVLALYKDKTELKGVAGKEYELMYSKELLNSCYGMMVTDIIREEITYSDIEEWGTSSPDIDKALEKYNKSWNRFTFYPWGVWVCAYARASLFTGIYEFITGGQTDPDQYTHDYVYSDTDSIKSINRYRHIDYLNRYNEGMRRMLYKAMDYHGLSRDLVEPKNIKGEKRLLGIWDYEGDYAIFKTLGAKRYMVKKGGEWSITVSGLNKHIAVPYLTDKYGDDCIEHFDDDLIIPAGYTGKQTHTYIDDELSGEVTDYLGNRGRYTEKSCIHMEGAEYKMGLADEYITYLTHLTSKK